MCCTPDAIKEMTKIQVDNFIIFFFCCLFIVYTMRFISMVILKEIISNCVTYSVTVCRTFKNQSLAIKTDNYSVYYNENEAGRWGGGGCIWTYWKWSLSITTDWNVFLVLEIFHSNYNSEGRGVWEEFISASKRNQPPYH